VKRENDALLAAEKLKSKKRSKNDAANQDDEEGAPAPKKRKTSKISADVVDATSSSTLAAGSSRAPRGKKTSKKNTPQDPLGALHAAALTASASFPTTPASVSSTSNASAHIITSAETTNSHTATNTTNSNTTTTTTVASLDALQRFEEHLADSASLKDTARRQFFKHANCFKYTGTKGDYILWAYRKTGEMSAAGYAWPSAFARDNTHTVHAAMWHAGKKNILSLVSLWAYSPSDDEHNNYYLKAYQKDVSVFGTKCRGTESPVIDLVCRGHFVSSDEHCVTDFHCAALEGISVVDMQSLEKTYGCVQRQN